MIAVAERPPTRALAVAIASDDAQDFARARLLCLGAILVFAFVFFAAQVRLYQAGTMRITDLADFVQPLHGLLNGTPWQVSIEHESIGLVGNRSIFSAHLFLFLVAFVPFYALVPHVYTLFALQALVPPLAAFLVLLLAQARLKNSRLALCLSLAYLLYLPVQWTVLNEGHYGFHIENFFPPLFLLGHYLLWHRRQTLAGLLVFALSLTVVETYAVMLACYGLYLVICTDRRRSGLGLLAMSVGYFAIAQLLVIPHFSQGAGAAYLDVFKGISGANPTTQHYFARAPRAILVYACFLFVPLLGLPLLQWRLLMVTLPMLGINFLSLLGGYYVPASPRSWHTNPIIPLFFLAAIGALGQLAIHPRFGPRSAQRIGLGLILAGLVLASLLGPLRWVFLRPSRYVIDYRAPALSAVAPLIPPDASLSADLMLGGRFVQRAQLHIFPAGWERSDYVLLDTNTLESYREVLRQIEQDPDFRLLYQQGSVYLFARRP